MTRQQCSQAFSLRPAFAKTIVNRFENEVVFLQNSVSLVPRHEWGLGTRLDLRVLFSQKWYDRWKKYQQMCQRNGCNKDHAEYCEVHVDVDQVQQ